MDLTKIVSWDRRCGVELTFMPSRKYVPSVLHVQCGDWKQEVLPKLHKAYQRDPENKSRLCGFLHFDPSVIEHSSPILTDWVHAREWYDRAVNLGRRHRLTPCRNDYIGGGGHVHIEVLDRLDRWALYKAMAGFPVLPLTTLAPNDLQNGNPHSWEGCFDPHANLYQPCSGWYTPAFNFRHQTMEYRAFDSAADWSIQCLQLALVQRFVQKFIKEGYTYLTRRQLRERVQRALNPKYGAKEFKHVITQVLELPWSEYEWMVERNLEPRQRLLKSLVGIRKTEEFEFRANSLFNNVTLLG